jgi:GrpB-like predicted nucleotidyltransferase (UPF0157 family)
MPIKIEDHNPRWKTEFESIKNHLQKDILKDIPIISIEHVGSTSIPGLVAKPVLDIDIIVDSVAVSSTRAALAEADYQDLGDMGVPGRYAFRQPGILVDGTTRNGEIRRNTYVVIDGCLSLRNHLDLKRILLEDEALREEYSNKKKQLVGSGVEDVDEYCRGKTEVAIKILKAAGWSEEELDEVRMANK